MTWDGAHYQEQFDALAAQGQDVHGEATFVMNLTPRSVLDAGCGTGRVAIELARRGVTVVGVDADPSMIATARLLAPDLDWVEADLTSLALGRDFDVVVMAGNVPLFTPPGTEAELVTSCARHVAPAGALVAGFQLDRGYTLATYDAHAAAAGLALTDRFATWEGDPFGAGSNYAVSVHRAEVFRFDHSYHFNATPDLLWSAMSRVDAYRDYWPWLRNIDGDGLAVGGVNNISVWAPVPWMIRLRITVTGIVEKRRIEVDVDGDLAGHATLDVGPSVSTDHQSTARLQWELVPASPAIRIAARLARPVLQSGQDWVVAVGVGQFRRRGSAR